MKSDIRIDNMWLGNNVYHKGTKFKYTGLCHTENGDVTLNNATCTFLYADFDKYYFDYNNEVYFCDKNKLAWNFRGFIQEYKAKPIQQQPTEEWTEWTEDMIVKTMWYVLIMIVAILFKEVIGIWILATIVWYKSTFKKNK